MMQLIPVVEEGGYLGYKLLPNKMYAELRCSIFASFENPWDYAEPSNLEDHRKKVEALAQIKIAREANIAFSVEYANGVYLLYRRNVFARNRAFSNGLPSGPSVKQEYYILEIDQVYVASCVLEQKPVRVNSIRDEKIVWKSKVGELSNLPPEDREGKDWKGQRERKRQSILYQGQCMCDWLAKSRSNPLRDTWKRKRMRRESRKSSMQSSAK